MQGDNSRHPERRQPPCATPTEGEMVVRGLFLRGGGGGHKALVVGSVSLRQRLLASRL